MLIVPVHEVRDGIPQLVLAFETISVEGLAGEQGEPDFDLVQPTRRSWRE